MTQPIAYPPSSGDPINVSRRRKRALRSWTWRLPVRTSLLFNSVTWSDLILHLLYRGRRREVALRWQTVRSEGDEERLCGIGGDDERCDVLAATFEPEKFEDHYEEALVELINAKRNGKTVGTKPRPRGENVVDLMDALKKSLATEATTTKGKKPRKASAGQKEMLLPIEGKRGAEKKAAKPVRATGRRKAG